ncbi:hypothetical protein JW777_00025, partial [bacterium]|nr:hypothetical protein [bacterium]
MPFWGVDRNDGMLTYIVENPFHNSIAFTDKAKSVDLAFTHTFPDNNDVDKPVTFIVYADHNASPIEPALHFRRRLEEQGKLVSLKEKMKTAPSVEGLIGAPHAYIWDGAPVTIADVRPDGWQPLARAVLEQAAAGIPSAGERIFAVLPRDSSAEETFKEAAGLSSPYSYLRRSMAHLLSQALRSPDFFSEAVWPPSTLPAEHRSTAETLTAGGPVDGPELVRFNSHLLHAAFPDYLTDPATWGNGVSTHMIDALSEAGLDRFVLTCDGIESIETRPHVAEYAAEHGFLIGPYDGYDSVHDPDSPQWPTAAFDRELYETCAVRRPDGTPVKGF